VIASIARELGILTVAIVTIPFSFEGRKRLQHAEEGISELKRYVDALIIIRNDKLRELYGNLTLRAAFGHADNVLTTAAKGIAELITVTGYINVDFEDVKTVMKESGVAIMGIGVANGESRASKAIEQALSSPLLSDDNVEGASNILLFITSGKDEILMDEITEITDYIKIKTKDTAEIIWGNGNDDSLEDKISVTVIATGFDKEHRRSKEPAKKPEKIIYTLGDQPKSNGTGLKSEETEEKPAEKEPEPELFSFKVKHPEITFNEPQKTESDLFDAQRTIIFDIEPLEQVQVQPAEELIVEESVAEKIVEEESSVFNPPLIKSVVEETIAYTKLNPQESLPLKQDEFQDPGKIQNERKLKLKQLSEKLKVHPSLDTHLYEIESVPAYKRRNVALTDVPPSSESQAPNYIVQANPDNNTNPINENKFLHNKAD